MLINSKIYRMQTKGSFASTLTSISQFQRSLKIIKIYRLVHGKLQKFSTHYFFTQQQFNLLHESNEGYSKLILLLSDQKSHSDIPLSKTTILNLVGYYKLDPSRIVCLLFNAIEFVLKTTFDNPIVRRTQSSIFTHSFDESNANAFSNSLKCFTELLHQFTTPNLLKLLSFYLSQQRGPIGSEEATTDNKFYPHSVYRLLSFLILSGIVSLQSVLSLISPSFEVCASVLTASLKDVRFGSVHQEPTTTLIPQPIKPVSDDHEFRHDEPETAVSPIIPNPMPSPTPTTVAPPQNPLGCADPNSFVPFFEIQGTLHPINLATSLVEMGATQFALDQIIYPIVECGGIVEVQGMMGDNPIIKQIATGQGEDESDVVHDEDGEIDDETEFIKTARAILTAPTSSPITPQTQRLIGSCHPSTQPLIDTTLRETLIFQVEHILFLFAQGQNDSTIPRSLRFTLTSPLHKSLEQYRQILHHSHHFALNAPTQEPTAVLCSLFPLLTQLGPLLSTNISTFEKVCLFIAAWLDFHNLTEITTETIQNQTLVMTSVDGVSVGEICSKIILLLVDVFFPALSLAVSTVSLTTAVWEVLRHFSALSRHAIYSKVCISSFHSPLLAKNTYLIEAELKKARRRISTSTVATVGKILTRLSLGNPFLVMAITFSTISAYPNFIRLLFDSLSSAPSLVWDTVSFVLLHNLNTSSQTVTKFFRTFTINGPAIMNIARFVGLACRDHSELEIAPLLQFVARECLKGNGECSVILSEIMKTACHIVPPDSIKPTAMHASQLLISDFQSQLMNESRQSSFKVASFQNALFAVLQKYTLGKKAHMDVLIRSLNATQLWDEMFVGLCRVVEKCEKLDELKDNIFELSGDEGSRMERMRQTSEDRDNTHDILLQYISFHHIALTNDLIEGPQKTFSFERLAHLLEQSPYPLVMKWLYPHLSPIVTQAPLTQPSPDAPSLTSFCHSFFDRSVWKVVPVSLFTLFWSLGLGDVYNPTKEYRSVKKKLTDSITEMRSKSNARDIDVSTRTAFKQLIPDYQQKISKVASDETSQRAHIDTFINNLSATDIFPDMTKEEVSSTPFIQMFFKLCIFPRISLSENDAFYAAEFLRIVGRASDKFSFYSVCAELVRLVCAMLPFSSSEESVRLGVFVARIFHGIESKAGHLTTSKQVQQSSSQSSEREEGKVDERKDVFFSVLREMASLIEQHLLPMLSLSNLNMAKLGLFFLSQISRHFPSTPKCYNTTIEKLDQFPSDGRKDVYTLAQSYRGVIMAESIGHEIEEAKMDIIREERRKKEEEEEEKKQKEKEEERKRLKAKEAERKSKEKEEERKRQRERDEERRKPQEDEKKVTEKPQDHSKEEEKKKEPPRIEKVKREESTKLNKDDRRDERKEDDRHSHHNSRDRRLSPSRRDRKDDDRHERRDKQIDRQYPDKFSRNERGSEIYPNDVGKGILPTPARSTDPKGEAPQRRQEAPRQPERKTEQPKVEPPKQPEKKTVPTQPSPTPEVKREPLIAPKVPAKSLDEEIRTGMKRSLKDIEDPNIDRPKPVRRLEEPSDTRHRVVETRPPADRQPKPQSPHSKVEPERPAQTTSIKLTPPSFHSQTTDPTQNRNQVNQGMTDRRQQLDWRRDDSRDPRNRRNGSYQRSYQQGYNQRR
ncbi:putative THO complex subunit 2 [Blattamonas nauphoetae]|uniref:THO complex subunit 2 n=1 Tax=Blattamonas nauphoetae TaxID=2049346 RepID=A0ABQ9XIZ9_9EUKA|nr:putative THO complex subunit 2 [Blattamonas nauphoetae]